MLIGTAYLKWVEGCLAEELLRVEQCLDPRSRNELMQVRPCLFTFSESAQIVEKELLARNESEILGLEGSGLLSMLTNDKMDGLLVCAVTSHCTDLRRINSLYVRVRGGIELACTFVRSHIEVSPLLICRLLSARPWVLHCNEKRMHHAQTL
jgi:hypothetical protein